MSGLGRKLKSATARRRPEADCVSDDEDDHDDDGNDDDGNDDDGHDDHDIDDDLDDNDDNDNDGHDDDDDHENNYYDCEKKQLPCVSDADDDDDC